jgi:hypothetical protein
MGGTVASTLIFSGVERLAADGVARFVDIYFLFKSIDFYSLFNMVLYNNYQFHGMQRQMLQKDSIVQNGKTVVRLYCFHTNRI